MTTLRIRTILPVITVLLVALVLAVAAQMAMQAMQNRGASNAFLRVNEAAELLLVSNGDLAVERGASNAALRAKAAATDGVRNEIARRRENADRSFQQALTSLTAVPEMERGQNAIEAAKKSFEGLRALRSRVDEALKTPLEARNAEVIEQAVPIVTHHIDQVARLRMTLETLARPTAAQIQQLVFLRHLGAAMAEYAGRERARLAGLISAKKLMSERDSQLIAEGRGQIILTWDAISILRLHPETPADLVDAINTVEKNYFGDYETLRKTVIAAGGTSDYPLTSKEYFDRVTFAIDSILAMNSSLGKLASNLAERDARSSGRQTIMAAGVFLLALLLAAASFWVAIFRIVRPVTAMTGAMERLAGGNTDIVIPGHGHKDEIGMMADAVQVFKENAIEKARLEQQQIEAAKTAVVERKKALLDMVEKIERETSVAVSSIETKAGQVGGVSQSMSDFATSVSTDTQSVAAASEEALVNAQTVSSAAEELTASIAEIATQVTRASEVTRRAVESGGRAERTIASLTETVARISEVTRLIGAIADQTNLLALNATIELARAGEAGRGFSVVASEVKNLANQTARSTADIDRQVSDIRTATDAAVAAVSEIGQNIAEIDSVASAIAAAMEQQEAVTQEIARNVAQTAEASREVSSRIQNVSQSARMVGDHAVEVREAVGDITGNIAELRHVLVKVVRTSTEDANRRMSARYALKLQCSVRTSGGVISAETVDLSESGANLRCSQPLSAGMRASLELPGISSPIPFAVCEARDERANIEFQCNEALETVFKNWFEASTRGLRNVG